MEGRLIAGLVLLPFAGIFIYTAIHEYRRYKSKGPASYGLVYDEETGRTHVSTIPEGEDGYDPEEFDPSDHNDPETRSDAESDKA